MSYGSLKGKVAVYTAIFGEHDLYVEPQLDGFDIYLITDGVPPGKPEHATVIAVPPDWKAPDGIDWRSLDDTRRARFWKLNSHLPVNPVSKYEYSLWVDASFTLDRPDVNKLVEKHLALADVATCRHPSVECIYEGALLAVACGKDDFAVVQAHLARYRAARYPARQGLAETGVLLRRHTPQVAEFNAYWWSELAQGSKRDQVSFNYCADTMGVRISYLDDRRALGFIHREHLR